MKTEEEKEKIEGKGGKKGLFSIRDIAVMGMMLAVLEVGKRALDFLPNIEVVSLLLIVYTVCYGWKTLIVAHLFAWMECLVFGMGTWVIAYMYVWPVLVIMILLFGKKHTALEYSIVSGFFGLFFGFLCSLINLVIGGPVSMFTWWIAGIPYDLVHCIGNFVVCLVLYKPLSAALGKVLKETG